MNKIREIGFLLAVLAVSPVLFLVAFITLSSEDKARRNK